MSEMIERVARAICAAENGNVGPNGCRECLLGYTAWLGVERKNCVGVHVATARAVIAAMREPTETMLDAGEAAFSVPDAIGAGDAWQAMIDAVLAPAQPPGAETE